MSEQFYILIVEDYRELARLLRAGIEALGENFVVFDAPSGEEAMLDAYRHEHINAAIIDLRLPGMDGREVARRLRERHPEIKIFLISGQSEAELRAAAEEVEADAWFLKPLELADLLDALERKLGLVSSILGDTPVSLSAAEEERAVGRMTDLMADLRDELAARAVLLLNDVGRVVLQAGALDSILSQETLLALMSLYAGGVKVSRMLHAPMPRFHFYLHTDELQLHLTSLSRQYALLVVCNQHCNPVSPDELATLMRHTVSGLLEVMKRLGILPSQQEDQDASPSLAEAAEETAEGGDDLLALLNAGLSAEEAEDFWEQLAADDEPPTHAINPDVLSYKQAQQLGLAPPGEEAPD